ncbi:MAG: ABC transporter ATP-binding protein [Alphaproteobacteria bacterium]|nr:MAG: ABC transporter ATP-binding protein [Alphaproteobacteria bacterium]
MSPLLEVEDLHVAFGQTSLADMVRRRRRLVHAVNGVSLTIERGETLGLVGESGCGKSTLGRALLRLVKARSGAVRFEGQDVLAMSPEELFRFRRKAQMVFQDPFSSLNPRLTVGETLAEVFRVHRLCPPAEIGARVRRLVETVGLSDDHLQRRPAALSGGQCQRVGIARALAVGPELVIADEAVSALDVSIQAQILNLFQRLQQEMHLTLLFISHDLGVVRHLCRNVAVMYLGRIVEYGPAEELFRAPRHPYTRALIEAMPRMAPDAALPLQGLAGEPPSPVQIPRGCAFHPRCPVAMPACRTDPPPEPHRVGAGTVWCRLYDSPAALGAVSGPPAAAKALDSKAAGASR